MATAFGPQSRAFGATTATPAVTFSAPFGAFHCPVCGYNGPVWHSGPSSSFPFAGFGPGGVAPVAFGGNIGGLGGLRQHGGTYSPEFIATGLPTDEEIVEMIYDNIDMDPLVPYDAAVEVECDAGVVTMTGAVSTPNIKHSAGDDAWWAPGVVDVRNNITVTGRRRLRTAPRVAP